MALQRSVWPKYTLYVCVRLGVRPYMACAVGCAAIHGVCGRTPSVLGVLG